MVIYSINIVKKLVKLQGTGDLKSVENHELD